MRFTFLASLIAGAGLVQVGAQPLRIIVVSEIHSSVPDLRVAFPAVPNHKWESAIRPVVQGGKPAHRGCGGANSKAIRISNAFRKALGMPLIETKPMEMHRDMGPTALTPVHHHHGQHRHHHDHFRHASAGESFTERLYIALSSLGVWEARAIAFVLGCGLGALLRMFFVLAIVSFRSFSGPREDEVEYHHVLFQEVDAEELAVAPPNYVYLDEKAPVAAEATAN